MLFDRKMKKSLFFSYTMSYISMLFLAIVIITVILLDYYAKDIMKSYREMEQYKILQMEEELNQQLDITNKLSYKIRTSVMFYPFYFERNEAKKMEVLEYFSLYKGSSLFLNDYFLIYPSREYAFSSNGTLYGFNDLLKIVWGADYPGDVRTVDVHIRRLREKIEENPSEPKYVHTKWGVGYYFLNE